MWGILSELGWALLRTSYEKKSCRSQSVRNQVCLVCGWIREREGKHAAHQPKPRHITHRSEEGCSDSHSEPSPDAG
jgi:hypothetical protein